LKIIYLAELKWQYLRTRKQQIITRFPADWRVLFIEPFTVGRANHFSRQQENQVTYLTVPYFKNFPQVMLQKLLRLAPVRGGVILANACWLWLVLHFSEFHRPQALVVSNIYYAPVVRLLFRHTPVLYDCNDDHLAFPLTPAWARKYFLSLCRRANRIVCSSQALKLKIPAADRAKVVLIGNGVDTALFTARAATMPEDLRGLRRPVLMYLGALSEWVDMDLLQRVAETHADKSLVLIGPVAAGVRPALARLQQLPNVHYLREISHDRIADYLAVADVGLIPFVKNELTAGVNPNKLYEYFAAGKAVVSMDISPEVMAYGEEIFLARDQESFVRQIAAAVAAAQQNIEPRQQLARAHDWQEKANQFSALVEQLAGRARV